jgi:hypothetical protein
MDAMWYVKHDNFTMNAADNPNRNAWRAWYAGVARANAVLKYVPGIRMDPSLQERLLGEAKFLRGVCYFNIVNIWGDAPLFTAELEQGELLSVTRQPKEALWAQIEKDFSEAEALPVQYSGSEAGRATRGAAKAFLARSYLYQGKFAQAAAKSREVIDLGIYSLHDEYIKNFQKAHENGVESVFEVQFTPGTGGWGNNEGNWVPTFTAPFNGKYAANGGFGIILPVVGHNQLYQAGDKRKAVNVFQAGDVFNGTPYDPTWGPTGLHVAKYTIGDLPSSGEGWIDAERNMPVVRYAEVLLIHAEALNETGQTALAEPFLNQVRNRAGLPALTGLSKEAFRDAILQERRIEFFAEGHRFFDLRRMGRANEFIRIGAGKSDYAEPKNLYFPIPQAERDVNKNLEQNPGY